VDGRLDVIAGSLWWAGPTFEKSYSYAPVKVFLIKAPGFKGYSNNFFTYLDLFTEDKWVDILKPGLCSRIVIWQCEIGYFLKY